MKKTIKSFMIFVGTLALISCNTPLDISIKINESSDTTEITDDEENPSDNENEDDSEITDNEENSSDNEENNESEIINENPSDNEEDNNESEIEIIDDASNNNENENNSNDDNNESEIINENPSDNENEDDSEITDNEENNESEIINDTSNNNGILSYNFDENTKVNNFEYVIYYNDNLMNWKYFAFTDDEKGCIIQINNMFNIRIDISSNNITVITYLDCPQDIKINNVEINNNTIIIKISNM